MTCRGVVVWYSENKSPPNGINRTNDQITIKTQRSPFNSFVDCIRRMPLLANVVVSLLCGEHSRSFVIEGLPPSIPLP